MVRPPPVNNVSVNDDDSNRVDQLKKGAWSEEEDGKLIAYIHRYGIWNWNQMPKAAGLVRSGKSCRLRWMNYLRPNIRHGDFTRDEENIIIKWHKLLGNKWSSIAAKLPERTDNEIKNVWNTYLKKRTTSSSSDNNKPNYDQEQRPKMSAAAPAVVTLDKTNQHSIDKSLSSSRETVSDDHSTVAVTSSSSIDNRAESESEVEGLCSRVPELQHDGMVFEDMFELCGGFLTNPYYYHQESLTNEWFIDDLWTV